MIERGTAMGRWWGRAVQVISWTVILAVTGVLTAAVLVPRIAGATPYTVLTGSMQPGLPPGTLLVVKPVDFQDIALGDVVTYQLESGQEAVVTHRVTGVSTSMTGQRSLVTQGDANDVTDREPVREVQVRGRLWYSVPHLGRVGAIVTQDQRQLAVTAVVGALAVYALAMFAGAARDRTRHKPADRPGVKEEVEA